jgi:hypothetical protein
VTQDPNYWGVARTVPSRRGRWGCVFLVLGVITVLAVVYGFLFMQLGQMLVVPTERIAAEVSDASGGTIYSTMYVPVPGSKGRFLFYVPSDLSEADGAQLACQVVRPTLAREGYADASFSIQDHGAGVLDIGAVIATEATACQ